MKISAIILAAGEGRRMKRRTPKALLPLGGKPLLMHSVEAFAAVPDVREIVLVVPPGLATRIWRRLSGPLACRKVAKVIHGGARRQDSVLRGLKASDPDMAVVLIHDSARPFITPDVIRRVARSAYIEGAALAALPARDTIKRVDGRGRVKETPDRRTLWTAQTPQGFRRDLLMAAYRDGHGKADATDDAQIAERAGLEVVVVEGDPANFKITSSEDLRMADVILQRHRRRRR